jgi:hypothetical protein
MQDIVIARHGFAHFHKKCTYNWQKNLATAIAEILAIWHNFSLELSYTTSRQKYHECDSGPANSQAKKSMTYKSLMLRKSLILVEAWHWAPS